MSEEKVGLIFEASGYSQFNKAVKDSELALRRQARALDESARELQKQILAAKGADKPNRELITSLQRQAQAAKLNATAIRAQVTAMREEAAAAKAVTRSNKEMTQSVESMKSAFSGMGRVFAPLLALASGGAVLKIANDFTQLQAKVKGSLDDAGQFDSVFRQIVDSSNRSGTAIDGVAQAFVRLRPAAKDLGVTNEKLIQFNETFAKMGSLAGATGEEIKNTMIQLSQGIASGALRGDELRSVMEQMPQVARTIAQSMGIPFSEFRKKAQEGKITAEEVFKAILDKSKEVDEQFAKLPGSIDRSMNRIVNAFSIMIGKMNEASGVIRNLTKFLDDLASDLTEATKHSTALNSIMSDLGGTANSLIGAFQGVLNLAGDLAPVFAEVATGARIAAFGVESLVLNLRELAIKHNNFWKSLGPNNDKKIQADQDAQLNAMYYESYERNKDLLTSLGLTTGEFTGATVLKPQPKPDKNSKVPPAPSDSKEKKKGPTLESIEKDRIQEIQQSFDNRIRFSRANAELNLAQMGSFADEKNVLTAKLKTDQDVTGILSQQLLRLNNTTVKTKDAQKALRNAISKTKLEMLDNAKAVQDAKNALDKYSADQGFQDFQRKQEYEAKRGEFIREQAIKGEEEQAQVEARLYEEKKISINAYYDDVLAHINNKEQVEKEAHEALIQRLEDEIAKRRELFKETDDSQNIKAIKAQQEAAKLAFQSIQADNQRERDNANNQRSKDLNAAAKSFGDSLEQAISTAIQDAFTGKGPLQAIKDFGKALRDILAKTIADAIAEGLRNSPMFTAISKSVGDLVNAISGRSKTRSIGPVSSISGLQEGQLDLSEFSSTGGGTSLLTAGTSKKVSPASGFSFAKILAPIAGAVGSYQAGKTLGQKFGRVGGGFAGMGAGALIGGIAGSVFGPVGTIIGASLGGTIGGIAGIMGGGGNKQSQRAAYQQNKLAPFLGSVVSTAQANSNDLNILNAQFMSAARGMKGRGSNGMAMKRDAMNQILQLIEQRRKTIEEFIKDTARQNEELRDQIALADAKPFEKAALEHQMAVKQIEYETKQLLDQYKDSEEAKTKILEQESLKRQQLSQQESEKFKTDTQDLRELLMQRDDAANANVFTRLRSREQVKADNLVHIDQEIAEAYLSLKGQLAAGVTPKDTLGLNQILGQLNAIGTQTNNLQIIIQQADDPNAVREEITRAFDAFFRKSMGANVA
jgi:tape measure domain-containing protein